ERTQGDRARLARTPEAIPPHDRRAAPAGGVVETTVETAHDAAPPEGRALPPTGESDSGSVGGARGGGAGTPAIPGAPGRPVIRPLDRYVFTEWVKIFTTTAIGFPVL